MKKANLFGRVIPALVMALVLCVGLVACGGSKPSGEKFVDTWTLVSGSGSSGDLELDEETLELVRSMGIEMKMDVKADGTFSLTLADETTNGSWEAVTPTTAEFEVDGSKVIGRLTTDDSLTLGDSESTMSFTRGELPVGSNISTTSDGIVTTNTPVAAPDGNSVSGGATSSTIGNTNLTFDDVVDSSLAPSSTDKASVPVSVSVANDEYITLDITAKGLDYDGDPILRYNITNNSNKRIFVLSGGCTVNGVKQEAYMVCALEPGQTKNDEYLFFDADESGITSVDQLTNINMQVGVFDENVSEVLSAYEFELK